MSRIQQDLMASKQDEIAPSGTPSTNMLRRIVPAGRVPHICVVGAGVAGLRCADLLTRKGLKVTIIEARDRIGGRVGVPCIKKKSC